jgi:hypothetical protein
MCLKLDEQRKYKHLYLYITEICWSKRQMFFDSKYDLTSVIPFNRIQNNPGIEIYYKNNFQEKNSLQEGTLSPHPYH